MKEGGARSRVRDYYDLWSILKHYQNHLDLGILPSMVIEKCALKGIHFSKPEDLFTAELIEDLDTAWSRWLEPYVTNLPEQHLVIRELRTELEKIWMGAIITSSESFSRLEK